jgi:ribosome-associated protein
MGHYGGQFDRLIVWYNLRRIEREDRLLEASDLAHRAVEAATEKQATDIVLLDVRDICNFADYFVLSTAESDRQINAVAEEIEKVLKAEGERPIHREGSADSGWVLLDYGDVIVHTFAPSERGFYNLEELWAGAKTLVRIQ